MTRDILAVAWRETRELVLRDGRVTGNVAHGVFILFVGVFLPWQIGEPWVRAAWVSLLWVWIPLFLVTTITADSFAGERERHTLETLLATRLPDSAILLGKVLAAVGYVWLAMLVALPLSLLTLNFFHEGGILLFALDAVVGLAGVSLLASLAGAAAGVLISLRAASVRQAQQGLGVAMMVFFLMPLFMVPVLPPETRTRVAELLLTGDPTALILPMAVVLAGLAIALLLAAHARFRRDRLILD